jgi:hypothetical protein
MNEEQIAETKQAIHVMAIQMETLASLPAVKQFIELSDKRNLMIRTLPPETKEGEV